MTQVELLRLAWTVIGFTGTLVGILALIVMQWLTREAQKDDWAITQVRPARMDFLRQHTRGEIRDLSIKAWVIGLLLVAVTADGFAGLAAIYGWGAMWVIQLIALSEALLVFSLIGLAALGIGKRRRRRVIFDTLRWNREAQ